MAHRLVQLELQLLGVQDDRRPPGGARVGAEERDGLLGHPRRFALEAEGFDVLPAGLCAPAAVCARIAPDLVRAVCGRERVEPGAALDELLLHRRAVGGDEHLALALRAHERLRHGHLRMGEGCFRAQAMLDLVVERDLDRIALHPRLVRPTGGRDRSEGPFVHARRGLGKGDRPLRRPRGALVRQAPVTGEAPRAADEDPHAEPFRLDVSNRLDAAVLRRDRLAPPDDGARVRIGRAGRERGFHGRGAEVAHAATLAARPLSAPPLQCARPRAGGGIGRRARLRALWPVGPWRFKSSPAHFVVSGRFDWSFQTDARAKPGRPGSGTASGAFAAHFVVFARTGRSFQTDVR